jgi:hypothetical protein
MGFVRNCTGTGNTKLPLVSTQVQVRGTDKKTIFKTATVKLVILLQVL